MAGAKDEMNLTDAEKTDQVMKQWFVGLMVAAVLFSGAVILFIL